MTDVALEYRVGSIARRRRSGTLIDTLLETAATGAGLIIMLMMAALVAVLLYAAIPSVRTFGASFFTQSTWRPNALEQTKRDATGKILRDADGEPLVESTPPAFG